MISAVDIERRQQRVSDDHDSGLRPQSAKSFTHTITLDNRLHTAITPPLLRPSYLIVICECDCAFGDASGDIRGVSMARCRSGQRLWSLTGTEQTPPHH